MGSWIEGEKKKPDGIYTTKTLPPDVHVRGQLVLGNSSPVGRGSTNGGKEETACGGGGKREGAVSTGFPKARRKSFQRNGRCSR